MRLLIYNNSIKLNSLAEVKDGKLHQMTRLIRSPAMGNSWVFKCRSS